MYKNLDKNVKFYIFAHNTSRDNITNNNYDRRVNIKYNK